MTTSNFVEKYLKGEAQIHEIDDRVDDWHNSKEDLGLLNEYLGLTLKEYCIWVQRPSMLKELLESR